MLTQEQYQQLKNKIVEAVPEIMELKLGCVVKMASKDKNEIVIRVEKMKQWHGEIMIETNESYGQTNSDLYTILGRPITLADVLRAIEKTRPSDFYRVYYAIESDGTFLLEGTDQGICWNPSADYDGQTDEVKEFLYKIFI